MSVLRRISLFVAVCVVLPLGMADVAHADTTVTFDHQWGCDGQQGYAEIAVDINSDEPGATFNIEFYGSVINNNPVGNGHHVYEVGPYAPGIYAVEVINTTTQETVGYYSIGFPCGTPLAQLSFNCVNDTPQFFVTIWEADGYSYDIKVAGLTVHSEVSASGNGTSYPLGTVADGAVVEVFWLQAQDPDTPILHTTNIVSSCVSEGTGAETPFGVDSYTTSAIAALFLLLGAGMVLVQRRRTA